MSGTRHKRDIDLTGYSKKSDFKKKKKVKSEEKPSVIGWSIELEWSNGKKENWADCDDHLDTQAIDDGISEYEQEKYPSPCQHGSIDPKSNMCLDCYEVFK